MSTTDLYARGWRDAKSKAVGSLEDAKRLLSGEIF